MLARGMHAIMKDIKDSLLAGEVTFEQLLRTKNSSAKVLREEHSKKKEVHMKALRKEGV